MTGRGQRFIYQHPAWMSCAEQLTSVCPPRTSSYLPYPFAHYKASSRYGAPPLGFRSHRAAPSRACHAGRWRQEYWRRQPQYCPEAEATLDRMFASAAASLNALYLSVRALEYHPPHHLSDDGFFDLGLAIRTAAHSQAAACIDWINAIRSASDIQRRSLGGAYASSSFSVDLSTGSRPSDPLRQPNTENTGTNVSMDESRDLGIVSSHEDGEANVEADFIQDRETLIVEKEIPPVPLCKGSHAEGNGLTDSLECPSITDAFRPSETVMLSKSSDLEIHNDVVSIPNFRRRSVKKNASESRNGTVEDRLDMMKSSLSEEKQRDLRDSDFLFDADFEAFLA